MTVQELIELLQQENPELVVTVCDGDYGGWYEATQVIAGVDIRIGC